jgi:hypothetical protein
VRELRSKILNWFKLTVLGRRNQGTWDLFTKNLNIAMHFMNFYIKPNLLARSNDNSKNVPHPPPPLILPIPSALFNKALPRHVCLALISGSYRISCVWRSVRPRIGQVRRNHIWSVRLAAGAGSDVFSLKRRRQWRIHRVSIGLR